MKNREAKYSLYVFPGLLGMLLIYGVPYVQLFLYSVQKSSADRQFAGAGHYTSLFANRAFLRALGNSAMFLGGGLALIIPLSILLALTISKIGRLQSFFRSSLLLPMFVPAVCMVMVLRLFFSWDGLFNSLLMQLGLEPLDWLGSGGEKVVMILMFLWRNVGLNVVVFTGALSSLPKDQVEAAGIDGAGSARIFFTITLRHLTPAIVFASLLSVMNAMKIFREIYLFTGDYPPEGMYLLGHFLNNMLRQMNYPRMSAAAVIFTVLSALLTSVLFFIEKRLRDGDN